MFERKMNIKKEHENGLLRGMMKGDFISTHLGSFEIYKIRKGLTFNPEAISLREEKGTIVEAIIPKKGACHYNIISPEHERFNEYKKFLKEISKRRFI